MFTTPLGSGTFIWLGRCRLLCMLTVHEPCGSFCLLFHVALKISHSGLSVQGHSLFVHYPDWVSVLVLSTARKPLWYWTLICVRSRMSWKLILLLCYFSRTSVWFSYGPRACLLLEHLMDLVHNVCTIALAFYAGRVLVPWEWNPFLALEVWFGDERCLAGALHLDLFLYIRT